MTAENLFLRSNNSQPTIFNALPLERRLPGWNGMGVFVIW